MFSAPALAVGNNCEGVTVGTPGLGDLCPGGTGNPIYALLQAAINWVVGIIGVVAVLAIVIAGIQYITSQGSPEGLKKAKSRITNAVIGLVLLVLMVAILKFIFPCSQLNVLGIGC